MTLPAPSPRRLSHTREVVYRGYRRDDGLWDIEGELRDHKALQFEIPGEGVWQPGQPLHQMLLRVTIDDDMVLRDIAVAMQAYPHGICPQSMAHMRRMIGCRMGPGWRQAIERHLGKEQGCAHLRELLYNLATAAYQTLVEARFESGSDAAPPHVGRCSAWGLGGPLVERAYPLLFRREAAA